MSIHKICHPSLLTVRLPGDSNIGFAWLRRLRRGLDGFGMSDKPLSMEDITIELQSRVLVRVFEEFQLRDAHILAHDWGGFVQSYIRHKKREPLLTSTEAALHCAQCQYSSQVPAVPSCY